MKTIKEIENQINDLQKELENLKNPHKRWRAEKGNYYYYVSFSKSIIIISETQDDLDNWNYDFWNYYKTKKEAEQARDRQLAIIRVNDRIDELNEGWVPKVNCRSYYIYDYYNQYFISYNFIIQKDKILKYTKTEEIAKQIISEMKDDLDLIFNIK